MSEDYFEFVPYRVRLLKSFRSEKYYLAIDITESVTVSHELPKDVFESFIKNSKRYAHLQENTK